MFAKCIAFGATFGAACPKRLTYRCFPNARSFRRALLDIALTDAMAYRAFRTVRSQFWHGLDGGWYQCSPGRGLSHTATLLTEQ